MFNNWTENVTKIIENATAFCNSQGIKYVGTEHLIYGILTVENCSANKILTKHGVNLEKFASVLTQTNDYNYKSVGFTPRTKSVLSDAGNFALELGSQFVGSEHLLFAILRSGLDSVAIRILQYLNINIESIVREIINVVNGVDIQSKNVGSGDISNLFEDFFGNPQPANSQNATQKDGIGKIEKFGEDLTLKAKQGKIDPVIGRSSEIERIIQVLCRKTKNNPVLVGEPGTGKSAVVEGLALKIANNDVPELLKGKTIFSLNLGSLIAGTKYRGEFEENFKTVIDEIRNNKNIILYIDEIHNIVGAGSTSESSMDAGEMLKPLLSRGEMQTIGATTLEEYRKYIEKDGALERRFQPIKVEPPTVDETIQILQGIKDKYEAHHKVIITDDAINAAAVLSDRYITDRFLPDKAIDLIDEASSRARLKNSTVPLDVKEIEDKISKLNLEMASASKKEEFERAQTLRNERNKLEKELEIKKSEWQKNHKEGSEVVTEKDIAEIVSNWTSIPVTRLTEEESARLLGLEEFLHKRVIGQDEAVSSISKAIRRARAGLKDPKRPIGSFIFVGPTGVGKTELTKALAEAMFGDENLMIRIDMSEYMESQSVAKLIGSAPGYVGFEQGGQLTEKVRRKPYSVILFDEIEKAHPDVFNVLLQILDDGRLTDSQGRVVDFKNTIIVLTSNIGARSISKVKLGFDSNKEKAISEFETMKDNIMAELKQSFRPEFLNRLDDIIVFHKLTKADTRKIAEIMIDGLKGRIKEKGMDVEVTENAVKWLTEKGYDEEYGARPMRRVIQRELEDNLAEQILMNNVKFSDKIVIDEKDGGIVFEKK